MILSFILAVSENGVIGRNNALPWHLPADLKRFKSLTIGHTIIMGRKTYESIGRPLPRRRSIAISRNPKFSAPGIEVAGSLEEALALCRDENEVFVIGGESVFKEALERADRLHVTLIHAQVPGDTFFPIEKLNRWTQVLDERHESDEKNAHPYSFRLYERPVS